MGEVGRVAEHGERGRRGKHKKCKRVFCQCCFARESDEFDQRVKGPLFGLMKASHKARRPFAVLLVDF